jgi:hypothetical protein
MSSSLNILMGSRSVLVGAEGKKSSLATTLLPPERKVLLFVQLISLCMLAKNLV